MCSFLLFATTFLWRMDSAPLEYKPNIVFILADDMGIGDVEPYSVYPAMNSHAKLSTPHLLQMAAEGMLFTDAYAGAPVCAPSRCTLMTGLHSGHCDVRANDQFLRVNTSTVADVLSASGYDTALFGKWGLGEANSSMQNDPISKGFDTYTGQLDQANCHNYYPSFQWNQQTKELIDANQNATPSTCGEPDYQLCQWTGDLWTENAVQYVSDASRHEKPFFMFVSYTTPHAGSVGNNSEYDVPIPRVSTSPYWKYNGTWPRVEIDYATAVTYVDEFVGRILSVLRTQNLDNSTIVFFASDNGASNEGNQDYRFFASSAALSGWKRSLKEGGHRTPLIIRWPDRIAAGSVTDYQWAFYDFLATVADLSNATETSVPDNDGDSMVPTLLGETQPQKQWVYHEYCAPNEDKTGWGQALRVGNYTGLCIGNQPKTSDDVPVCDKEKTFKLYDLATDLNQTIDIAKNHSDIVEEMWNIMIEQHSQGNYCGYAD